MNSSVHWLWVALVQISIHGTSGVEKILSDICIYAKDQCPNKHITFWFYTNETQDDPLQLDPLNLTANIFEPKLPLKILIHGYTLSRDLSPNIEIRPVLLETQSVHVISVDYSPLSRNPCYYPWAVQNVSIVSKCLAQLIDNFIDNGIYAREDIHLIGFSLGAQIAGFIANYAKNRLKHITGLDPAYPGFRTDNINEKLDATDADFVDVIHTDPFFYGQLEFTGHVDFYPNFEYFHQLGCGYWQDGRLRNCNHYRAPLYYAESITSDVGFWSYNCGDWLEFMLKRCNNYGQIAEAQMGYFVSEKASGSYFLRTRTVMPFAKGQLIDWELETSEQK